MAFRLPVTSHQLEDSPRPIGPPIVPNLLLDASRATGLVKIDLYNNGELPINGINIYVADSVLYAADAPSARYPNSGAITLDNLLP